jgi:hypothetical protein
MKKIIRRVSFRVLVDPEKNTTSLNITFPSDIRQQLMRFPGYLVSARSLLLVTVVVLLWSLQFPEALSVVRTFIDLFALISQ